MEDINKLVESNDIGKISYYLEYTEVLMDFFKNRDKCTLKLEEEYEILLKKYNELKKAKNNFK